MIRGFNNCFYERNPLYDTDNYLQSLLELIRTLRNYKWFSKSI